MSKHFKTFAANVNVRLGEKRATLRVKYEPAADPEQEDDQLAVFEGRKRLAVSVQLSSLGGELVAIVTHVVTKPQWGMHTKPEIDITQRSAALLIADGIIASIDKHGDHELPE